MYKKILVPLDGSALAECVIPHIESIAKPWKSDVELISVVEPIEIPTRGKIALDDEDLKQINNELKQETHKYLLNVARRLENAGISAESIIIVGKTAESLIEYTNDNDVDLIIMATHGRSGISKWFWGSITEKVLRAVNIPVLLIKATESCKDNKE
jgi:nucleotide-binding universal stress UspA family protein